MKRKFFSLFRKSTKRGERYTSPVELDTELAIDQLMTLAHTDIDAVELYIALASLYRVQGDIENALQIHSRLLVRRDISHNVKARLYGELGKDYKRAGLLDRAIASFVQAYEMGYADNTFLYEMIDAYDMLGEYDSAVNIAHRMKDSLGEAYYTVKPYMKDGTLLSSHKSEIIKAIDVSPELAQSWVFLLCIYSNKKSLPQFRSSCIEALNYIPVSFLLFELYGISESFANASPDVREEIVAFFDALISKSFSEDFLLFYYLGILYKKTGNNARALEVFMKSSLLRPDFWASQYELFFLTLPKIAEDIPFKNPAYFFIEAGRNINRFVCSVCALQLNTAFSLCPRCKHIQSICFRTTL